MLMSGLAVLARGGRGRGHHAWQQPEGIGCKSVLAERKGLMTVLPQTRHEGVRKRERERESNPAAFILVANISEPGCVWLRVPLSCVCVCVKRERESEREREGNRTREKEQTAEENMKKTVVDQALFLLLFFSSHSPFSNSSLTSKGSRKLAH